MAENDVEDLLEARFGERIEAPEHLRSDATLAALAGRRTIRRYADRAVSAALLRLVCATALSAPSKSDLQQADIVVVQDADARRALAELVPSMPWIGAAPAFVVVCGDNRRQRVLAAHHGQPFPNDHLDAFFNAAVDGALVLAQLLAAAEAAGLGTCPISVLRDHAIRVSTILDLPDHVFPIAGVCLGFPAEERGIAPRLDLALTLHQDRYDATALEEKLERSDDRRERVHAEWGQDGFRWSRAKAAQYAEPQRVDFGAFVRAKGFRLD